MITGLTKTGLTVLPGEVNDYAVPSCSRRIDLDILLKSCQHLTDGGMSASKGLFEAKGCSF